MTRKDMEYIYEKQKELIILERIDSLLTWDKHTTMPKNGFRTRSEAESLIETISHKLLVSNGLYDSVRRLRKANLSKEEKAMVDKLYRRILKSRKLPEEFVGKMSKETSLAYGAWVEARKKSDFEIFKPHLERIVKLKIKEASYIGIKGHPYNSLLDHFEEGMTVERLIPVFAKLKVDLLDLSAKVESSEVYKNKKIRYIKLNFDRDKQMKVCRDVSRRIGIDEDFSRIGVSEHPFTAKMGIDDVRFTINFHDNVMHAFSSTIHEVGHTLYDLNTPKNYTVLSDAPSFGIHESQSRFWENMIGKSRSFWKYYLKKFRKEFRINPKLDEFLIEVNDVHNGLIRIESDELYYCLHIILRFEIELGLIDGKIKVKDLPKIWNEKMREITGKYPKNNAEGVLQDVHWSSGYFGYFPTYAIGTIYAAQIFNSLKKKYPDIEDDITAGDYTKIREWLIKNIHSKGSLYLAEEIIRQCCGEGLNPEAYIEYLTAKYREIYKF